MLDRFDWHTVIAIGIIAAAVAAAMIVSWLITRRGPPGALLSGSPVSGNRLFMLRPLMAVDHH